MVSVALTKRIYGFRCVDATRWPKGLSLAVAPVGPQAKPEAKVRSNVRSKVGSNVGKGCVMVSRFKSGALVAGFLGTAALASPVDVARAADMPDYYQAPQGVIVEEFVSGWYLRGDIGWRNDTKVGSVVSDFPLPTNNRIQDVATIGVGGGYKYNWFRADVTVDYAGRPKFNGDGTYANAFSGKFESLTALANVYIDLGTWGGFTPYIGAGAGIMAARTYDFVGPLGVVTLDNQSRVEFAWAYMAGVSYAFAPRWLLDFSYRRLNLGDVSFNPTLDNWLKLKDLTANEFRIGLRYQLD
jgi:opacity protein-like surface antigen